MQTLSRILVGVDFHRTTGELPLPTRRAIEKSLWLAEKTGAKLTLMSVLRGPAPSSENELESSAGSEYQHLISEQIETFIEKGRSAGVEVSSKFVYGRGWYELTREVIREDFDLIIVGTREKSAATRMLYGSTAVKLLRKCPCPVWVTRPDVDPESATTIVAADDLSPVGEKVLHTAVSTAQFIDARLLIVSAVSYPLEGAMMRTECSQEDLDKYRLKIQTDAEREVFDRLSMTDYRTIQQGTQIIVQGGPADTVVEQVVVENHADLLVMGTIGRGGVPGFLIGNTAERLLYGLQCSLLAIKPDDFVSPVKVD